MDHRIFDTPTSSRDNIGQPGVSNCVNASFVVASTNFPEQEVDRSFQGMLPCILRNIVHFALSDFFDPTLNGFEFILISDIIRCQSDVNYTTIYTKDKKTLVVAKTLKEFESILSDYNFFRLHNSHLVNLACIKSYHKGKGGYVQLTDNTELEVSSRRKDGLLAKLTSAGRR